MQNIIMNFNLLQNNNNLKAFRETQNDQ